MRESPPPEPEPEPVPFSDGGRESDRAPEEENLTVEPIRPGEANMMGEVGAVEPGPSDERGAAG